jgi:hypothetical protein
MSLCGFPSIRGHGISTFITLQFRKAQKFEAEVLDSCGNGGEGGIRTLGTLLEYGALAKRCFRPLSHLTSFFFYHAEGMDSGQSETVDRAVSLENFLRKPAEKLRG